MFDVNDLPVRIASKVDADGECWLWTASVNQAGYGQLNWKKKIQRAHRVIYELLVGPIPQREDFD